MYANTASDLIDNQYLESLEEEQGRVDAAIKEREVNITKTEALRQATLRNEVNFTKYANQTVEQFLKVKGENSNWHDNISTEAIVGASAGGVFILLLIVAIQVKFQLDNKYNQVELRKIN